MNEVEIIPARGPGQPSKYRPEYCADVVAHMQSGASLSSFAASVGVDRKTLDKWRSAHEDFADAVAAGKAACAAWWEQRLRDVAEGKGGPGSATACIFGVKNMGADDWSDTQKHEHVGRIHHQALSHEEAIAEAARRGLPTRVLEE